MTRALYLAFICFVLAQIVRASQRFAAKVCQPQEWRVQKGMGKLEGRKRVKRNRGREETTSRPAQRIGDKFVVPAAPASVCRFGAEMDPVQWVRLGLLSEG